jgi:NAD(P)-dependent dehydrogenase (short-subunit alcohol dehydrogenase family)
MVNTYIVTGANRGLGLEFVKQISARGDVVFACARNVDTSNDLRALVDNKHVYAIRLDVTDADSIKVLVIILLSCRITNILV